MTFEYYVDLIEYTYKTDDGFMGQNYIVDTAFSND